MPAICPPAPGINPMMTPTVLPMNKARTLLSTSRMELTTLCCAVFIRVMIFLFRPISNISTTWGMANRPIKAAIT